MSSRRRPTRRPDDQPVAAGEGVRGSGRHWDPEEVAQIFEPFYRGGDVLARGTRGLGVGLTLAQETARQLGGTIEVESGPGAGSCFTVVLPRDPRP